MATPDLWLPSRPQSNAAIPCHGTAAVDRHVLYKN